MNVAEQIKAKQAELEALNKLINSGQKDEETFKRRSALQQELNKLRSQSQQGGGQQQGMQKGGQPMQKNCDDKGNCSSNGNGNGDKRNR